MDKTLHDAQAAKNTCEVLALELGVTFGDKQESIWPALLRDGENLVLVDCGYPGFLSKLEAVFKENGLSLAGLTAVFITHHDHDHVGALAELLAAYPSVQVYAAAAQAPFIRGEEKSLRLQQAERLHDGLPEAEKPGSLQIQKLFASVRPGRVDVVVKGGDVLPWCGGCQVVDTSGHMPEHLSLYLPGCKTFIAGDALSAEGGVVGAANPQYTLDMAGAKRSIAGLLEYDIERVICYHGGVCTGDIRRQLLAILE